MYSHRRDTRSETLAERGFHVRPYLLGVIAEDVPDKVGTADKKEVTPMSIIAVLSKVVKRQQEMLITMSEQIHGLEQRIS